LKKNGKNSSKRGACAVRKVERFGRDSDRVRVYYRHGASFHSEGFILLN
jgi:hypothetical protein